MIKLLKFTILLLPEKEQILSLGNIILEQIIFNIGFTQIKAFIKFIPILFDFLAGEKNELIILQKNQKILKLLNKILKIHFLIPTKIKQKKNISQITAMIIRN